MGGGAAQVVDKESAMNLAALRGQVWRCFGSSDMTDWLSGLSVFFCTEGPAITISGWTDYFDFGGEDDTYSLLKIDGGADDFEEAERAGQLYSSQAGQEVADVLVVRETVVETRDGHESWRYVTDVAIVFQLSESVIAVEKVSHHSELLSIATAAAMDELPKNEQVSSQWRSGPGVTYAFDRQVIRIEDLLGNTYSTSVEPPMQFDDGLA